MLLVDETDRRALDEPRARRGAAPGRRAGCSSRRASVPGSGRHLGTPSIGRRPPRTVDHHGHPRRGRVVVALLVAAALVVLARSGPAAAGVVVRPRASDLRLGLPVPSTCAGELRRGLGHSLEEWWLYGPGGQIGLLALLVVAGSGGAWPRSRQRRTSASPRRLRLGRHTLGARGRAQPPAGAKRGIPARRQRAHGDLRSRCAGQLGQRDRRRFAFQCECGQSPTCGGQVELTLGEYEQVRAQADRFVVVPGHEDPVIEHVIRRNDWYVVVDKVAAVEQEVGATGYPPRTADRRFVFRRRRGGPDEPAPAPFSRLRRRRVVVDDVVEVLPEGVALILPGLS